MKEKTLEFIKKSLAITLIIVVSIRLSYSQSTIDTSFVIEKKLTNDQIVFLNASSTDVDIKTWDKSEIKVIYHFNIKSKDRNTSLEFFKALKNSAITNISSNNNNEVDVSLPIEDYLHYRTKLTVNLKKNKKSYQLKDLQKNITIYTSRKNALKLKTSFNHVKIGNFDADVDIKASSTHLSLGNAKKMKLTASFSKGIKIGNIQSANFTLRSSSIKMQNISENLTMNASFSKFESQKIGGNAEIKLNSSGFEAQSAQEIVLRGSFIRKFHLQKVNKAVFDINSSEIEIDELENAEITNCSFSDFDIKKISSINVVTSNSSKFRIDYIDNLIMGKASFCHIRIGELTSSLKCNTHSGDLEIGKLNKNFKELNVDGQFTDISIITSPESSFSLKANLQFPDYSFNDIPFKKIEKNSSSVEIIGQKGDSSNSEIILNCKSCDIEVE